MAKAVLVAEKKQELQIQETSLNPANLIAQAIEKGLGIEQLQGLMDLQERWEKKEARKKFFHALAKFQTIVPKLQKSKNVSVPTRTGGSFSYKYADLGAISETIKKPLSECGLTYRWEFHETNQQMKVTCLISHEDGHTESTSMEGGKDASGAKNDIQQKGSTHTYLQRYTLIGALGLTTADQDNDGKTASKKQQEPQPEKTRKEIIADWIEALEKMDTRIKLKTFYLQNKKLVDNDPEIQQLFTDKRASLPEIKETTTPQTDLP